MPDESENKTISSPAHAVGASTSPFGAGRALRTAVGGVLMGTANLIPGVSGGTMILAIGLYEEFIDAVADLTALRFSLRRVVFLGILATAAGGAIVLLSQVILHLLLWYSSAMFALFIGLTLGGTPLLVKMVGRFRAASVVGVVAGFALMAGIAGLKHLGELSMPRNVVMDFVSGIVGSTTMVLPGISGSYMLLILDQYDRVIGAVADVKEALSGDAISVFEPLKILVPVGIGAVVGIVGLSNLLKYLLRRHEQVTLGVLLGMLLGSVLGLWPFDRKPTEKILEQPTTAQLRQYAESRGIGGVETLEGAQLVEHILDHWQTRRQHPTDSGEVAIAVAMLVAGLGVTVLLGCFSQNQKRLV